MNLHFGVISEASMKYYRYLCTQPGL